MEPQVIRMNVSSDTVVFPMRVCEPADITMTVSTAINMGGLIEHYDGAYTVTPKAAEEQVLETRYKVMDDNVTVLKVPYWETSNTSGTTVYIASEVN